MKIREFTGKTTQEAIDNGLAELGVTISEVKIDVLQEGAKGLFGFFGSKPAQVRLTVLEDENDDDDGLSDLIGSLSIDEKKKPAPKAEKPAAPKAEKPAAPKAEKPAAPKAEKPAAPKAEKPAAPKAEKPAAPKAEKPENVTEEAAAPKAEKPARPPRQKKPRAPKPEMPAAETESEPKHYEPMVAAEPFAPTEPPVIFPEGTPAGCAQRFLQEVTSLMNVKVDVYVDDSKEDNLFIHMIGDTLGILIGRRGETLDALQYLTSLQVNKGRDGYIRVTLDTENYRAKREDSLRRLALRMANKAKKTGRKVVLEPMNPYERRVLHTALQDNDAVSTHSEGEEPNRRVVITLKGAAPAEKQEKPTKETASSDKPKSRRRHHHGRRGPKPAAQGEAQVTEAPVSDAE